MSLVDSSTQTEQTSESKKGVLNREMVDSQTQTEYARENSIVGVQTGGSGCNRVSVANRHTTCLVRSIITNRGGDVFDES